MTYAEFFSEIKGRFMEADVSGIREHLAYQFNITGKAVYITISRPNPQYWRH